MNLRYIDWNIKCYCDIEGIIICLERAISDESCIVALQEVMPGQRAERLKEVFGDRFDILYSMDYRKADDEFDTDNRRLGVMLLISKDIEIECAGIFNRCLFPERTLYATVMLNGMERRFATFHSITGVSFKMGKAVQFRSFAECIRDYRPDIISLDANEPKVDHYDINCMEFFDQGDQGKGAKCFFDQIQRLGLRDAYVDMYDQKKYIVGEPLSVSHILPNGQKRRYDFIFVAEGMQVTDMAYNYDMAVDASSDHAVLRADIEV